MSSSPSGKRYRSAANPTDRLLLHGLHFCGHHGESQAERRAGGEFTVDLDVETDTAAAGRSDDLRDTVNYVDLHEVVRGLVEEREFHLLETLAARIAEELLRIPGVERVHLRVGKSPQLPGQSTGFAVEITRPS
ncbi:MAG: dihydroneopterin aldolase [Candidatus Dormibacteria bacterium]|jgi:dihydroneopterin aldolase